MFSVSPAVEIKVLVQIFRHKVLRMRVVSFIEDSDVIRKILKHLNLWDLQRPPRPVAHAPPTQVFPTYDEHPAPSADDYTCPPLEDHRSGLSYGFLLLNKKTDES